jgi:hypothetical protein
MLESGEVRKRLRQTIEAAKRDAAARRAALGDVQKEYDAFLENHAMPVFRQIAGALRAEGHVFQVVSPAGNIRLVSERDKDDYLELFFDVDRQFPTVVGRVSRVRGTELTSSEQPVRGNAKVSDLTGEDVLDWILRVIVPFVER